MGLDVRMRAWKTEPVGDGRCLACGECVERCPRGLLRFEPIAKVPPRMSGEVRPGERRTTLAGGRRRHVLIGGGPASIAAAEAIRAAAPDDEIVLVVADPHGYYSRPGLAYFITGELPERRLFPLAPRLDDLGVAVLRDEAVALDPAGRRVTLASGRLLEYDRLLLATGSRAIRARIPGADLDGVVKLDDLDDARDLVRRSRSARAAVVAGGGITALEIVEGLRARGVLVHYFLRGERYWSNVLSENESRIIEEALVREGVSLHRFTELHGAVGRGGSLRAVRTRSGEEVACDILAVAVGVRPQIGLAVAAGLACDRGVLVDEHLRSSDPRVFAAGDIAEVLDRRTGLRAVDVLWNAAIRKGRIAGVNMATDEAHVYDEGLPLNVTRLAGLHTTIIGTVGSGADADLQGLTRGDSQVWSELHEAAMVQAHRGEAHVRIALGEKAIAGAVVMGDQAVSRALQELVEGRVDLGSIAARLTAPGAPVIELVTGLWEEWRAGRVPATR